MKKELVISFDCWGTIIKPSDEVWTTIALTINDLCVDKLGVATILDMSKKVNKKLDILSQREAKEYVQYERIRCVLMALGINHDNFNVAAVARGIDEAIDNADKPAILINSQLIDLLSSIKHYRTIMLSNSGLISGKQTKCILDKLNLSPYFDEYYFSDYIGYAKPDIRIYKYLIEKEGVPSDSILHIGDNWELDISTPKQLGMNTIHFDHNSKHDISFVKEKVLRFINFENLSKSNYEINKHHKYKINYIETDGTFKDDTDEFNEKIYSEMKHGVRTSLEYVSNEIFDVILSRIDIANPKKTPPVFVEVIGEINSASTLLSRIVKNKVNGYRNEYGLPPATSFSIHRAVDTFESYSTIPKSRRHEGIFSDYKSDEQVESSVIIVDDVFVSGVFTKQVSNKLVQLGAIDLSFVYYATLHTTKDQENLPVEYYLNTSHIKAIGQLNDAILRNDFTPTRRYYKLLLSEGSEALINEHFDCMSNNIILLVYKDLNKINIKYINKEYRAKLPVLISNLERRL